MSLHDAPYDDCWSDPCSADEPAFEDGPISAGGRGRVRRPRRAAAPSDGAVPEAASETAPANRSGAAAAAPSDSPPAGPTGTAFPSGQPGAEPADPPDSVSPAAPVSPAHAILNFVGGVAALAGVFLAVLVLEFLGLFLGYELLDVLEAIGLLGLLPEAEQLMIVDIAIQLTWLAAAAAWWAHLRPRGIGIARPRPPRAPAPRDGESPTAQRALAVILLGVGLQVAISILLGLILPLFPEVMESYDSLMEESGVTTFSLLGVVSVAVLAPIVEEVTFRGIAFQYALRAVCPGWRGRRDSRGQERRHPGPTRFWVANILQALVFGAMHLNITQGLYAFAIGLVCGWLFWRTGELRWSMGLHAALNLSSYFVSELLELMSLFGLFELGELVFPVLFVYWGLKLFARGSEETALA